MRFEPHIVIAQVVDTLEDSPTRTAIGHNANLNFIRKTPLKLNDSLGQEK